jgi:hypothetical protein
MSELNSVYHEGPLTMAKDGNTIYFLAKVLMRSYLKKINKKVKVWSGWFV